jgi:two-component system, OmpR family, phosphate regulon response regulator PhoB
MATILIVEDEEDLRQVLLFNLEAAGHRVVTASRGAEGLRLVKQESPELVLLDIMLPDVTGLDVCRQIKTDPTTKHVCVVMLTARAEEIDRVVGFELGADDYVTKPFSVRELTLRISAILRRNIGTPSEDSMVEFGVLRLDRGGYRAWVEGRELELTALEFNLLITLYDRRDRVQARPTLLEDVWGVSADVTTRTVDTHVKRLREKLGAARDYIETVRGVGYRFIGQLSD